MGFLGGGVPLPSRLGDLGERRELPQRGPGRSPGRQRILGIFHGLRILLVETMHYGTNPVLEVARRGGSKTRLPDVVVVASSDTQMSSSAAAAAAACIRLLYDKPMTALERRTVLLLLLLSVLLLLLRVLLVVEVVAVRLAAGQGHATG